MKQFKIATWNVNSLRVRLEHVLQWLQTEKPDVLALQEIKMIDEDFPIAEFQQAGYHVSFSGQRTYNGMAVLSLQPMSDVVKSFPGFDDPQRRVLAVSIDSWRIINLYFPNGESVGSEKYLYKLSWLNALKKFLQQELAEHAQMIVLGDFNIAPENEDVHDPALWEGRVLFSDAERAEFKEILKLGLQDCFRLQKQPEKSFSWWDYRMNAFKRNLGLRIDHILISQGFAPACQQCYIDKGPRALERPSDHAPVVAEFNLKE